MGRLPENYIGPKERVLNLKKDFPYEQSAVLTNATPIVVGDTLCVLIKATIVINGKEVAEGHAFTDSPEEDKAVEKTETTAIGRALVNAGYAELSEEDADSYVKSKSEKPKAANGLGSKSSKRATSEVEEEEDVEDSEEDEKPVKKSSGLGGKLGGKSNPLKTTAKDLILREMSLKKRQRQRMKKKLKNLQKKNP